MKTAVYNSPQKDKLLANEPETKVATVGLLITVTAKPGKEDTVSDMLGSALSLVQAEEQTVSWYAFRMADATFGVFNTFEDRSGRRAHLNGRIAGALMQADDLLTKPPRIEEVTILAVKA
jgi:quinol monooxygenase YgiN